MEEYPSDFVLETKQIVIPGHPYAFNPSIIRWRGRLLMCFREISKPLDDAYCAAESSLYLVYLDENFSPLGKPAKLQLGPPDSPSRTEDGRLISLGSELYLIYSDNQEKIITNGGFRVYAAHLDFDGIEFHVLQNECLSEFEGQSEDVREKNWAPFDYEGNLLLIYSISPHKILLPALDGTGICETYVSTRPSIVWEWGELRGGTPALLFDEDYYLSFFHSSKMLCSEHSLGQPSLHYFMGAYLFDRNPPFKIKKISPEPIIGENFYKGEHYEPYWKPVNVVFPCGFIIDEDAVWISYGRQDHEICIAKLDRQKLSKCLINVSTVRRSRNASSNPD